MSETTDKQPSPVNEPVIWLNQGEVCGETDDSGVFLNPNHQGRGPAVFLRGPYAAAPDLLAACKVMLKYIESTADICQHEIPSCGPSGYCLQARAAIAKAEGA